MPISENFGKRYGPWALVTGASSGIGESFAKLLARQGFSLILVARREERLRLLQGELLRDHGASSELVIEDLADATAIDRVVAMAKKFDVGLVVSNAGFGLKGGFGSHSAAQLDAMLNVNARAPLMLVHALLPTLRTRATSGIIITGSQEGESPFPWSSAYAATKAFVHNFGLSLYGELHGTGCDVLVLAPGSTDTEAPITQGFKREDLLGLMSPDEVARQALENLGKKPLHIPAWYNQLMVGMMRLLPRRLAIALAGKSMASFLAKGGHPVKH